METLLGRYLLHEDIQVGGITKWYEYNYISFKLKNKFQPHRKMVG